MSLHCSFYHSTVELAEMEVQREEVSKLEMELSEAEETLEQEKAKSEGLAVRYLHLTMLICLP